VTLTDSLSLDPPLRAKPRFPPALYRFESNVRSAAVVGMVGAGGIGYVLYDIIRAFEYGKTCAVLLILIVSVTVIDLVSSKIRKTLI